jgi:indoleamine 2,3-dioxygenase
LTFSVVIPARIADVKAVFRERGFLPRQDPIGAFPHGPEFAVLDELGRDLPSLLRTS